MFITFLDIIFLILFLYIGLSTLYLFIIAIAGKMLKGKSYTVNAQKKRIAVIIPSYKEDEIIYHTAFEAINHRYDKDAFEVIVIADQLLPATVQKLKTIVRVIEVDFEKSMKARSLHAAFSLLRNEGFEIVMILDADNVMGDGCLEKVNDAFHKGAQAVQTHRTAKNKNTPVAVLDAISEEININLFRRGPAYAGLSAAPIGSGMAFRFSLIDEIFSLDHILNNPGEDREIDMQLMKRKINMEFIDDAYVYDEKVSSSHVFEKQRIRWLEAQAAHIRRFFDRDMKNAPKTIVYFNKLLQIFLLPRLLFLVLFTLITLVLLAQQIAGVQLLFPSASWWLVTMVIYLLTLFISVPAVFYTMETVKAVVHIPVLMFSMIRAIFKMKKNRSEFLHTPKNVIIK
jgi:cellulose synthase/poly-beta-1,6-N-acetylglucosamine synthase-like glycosyltransferase